MCFVKVPTRKTLCFNAAPDDNEYPVFRVVFDPDQWALQALVICTRVLLLAAMLTFVVKVLRLSASRIRSRFAKRRGTRTVGCAATSTIKVLDAAWCAVHALALALDAVVVDFTGRYLRCEK